jgi:hypothetical protein
VCGVGKGERERVYTRVGGDCAHQELKVATCLGEITCETTQWRNGTSSNECRSESAYGAAGGGAAGTSMKCTLIYAASLWDASVTLR